MRDIHNEIKYLRSEIEKRDVEIEVLKQQLETHTATLDEHFGLTKLQRRIFMAIWNKRAMTVDALASAVYFDREEPEIIPNIINVMIFRIRKALKPFGIKILHKRGDIGYFFDEPSRKIIKEMNLGV